MTAGGRIAIGETNEGVWEVPYELAIACSKSVFVGVIRDRALRGVYPLSTKITAHGRQLLAIVSYAESDVCFQLDVQLQALRQ